jgi:hypothetical protein
LFLSLIAVALVATPEVAPAEPVLLASAAAPSVIVDPDWVRTPTIEELIATFPVAAIEKGASARR